MMLDSIVYMLRECMCIYIYIKSYKNILYCIVLYCIVLYCIVLYCIVLYCIVLIIDVSFGKNTRVGPGNVSYSLFSNVVL